MNNIAKVLQEDLLEVAHKMPGTEYQNWVASTATLTFPKVETIGDDSLVISDDAYLVPANKSISMAGLVDQLKHDMGYLRNPLTKCQHCGQWGAAYCACIKCGAPIDPAE
jgi:hypothetical protein